MTAEAGAADQLSGRVLLDRWVVVEKLRRDPGASSEARSVCYRAVDSVGNIAFVKAFDFKALERKGDIQKLEDMAREFNHEKRVHELCLDKRLGRVTRIYDSGNCDVGSETVHYIVCEYAPQSLRDAYPPGEPDVPASQRLAALRHVAAGLAQLHGIGIAHQDIKPSNVVAFDDATVKVTDLGSSSSMDLPPVPHDDYSFCGQPNFAPPELLYGESGTWYRRRVGCDMYLLGNLLFTSFVGHSLTYILSHALPRELRHTVYTGSYELVLPFWVENHYAIVPLMLKDCVPSKIVDEIASIVLEMCHPDPELRGHRRNRLGSGAKYGLERYISAFDRLSKMSSRIERNG
ncbi:protein kinase domain-containing protein [Stenotrophomonas indicatrix]|uniref:protein kinase domain-containing protein n=1 Tax=Stenotrophomonas indicatrix TaxID=2045451 RepID=UPI000FDA5D34|nr:protein kinase [Stenotrophomonas indicatrix]